MVLVAVSMVVVKPRQVDVRTLAMPCGVGYSVRMRNRRQLTGDESEEQQN